MKHLLFILMLLQPMLLNAQKSALEDYFKSYFAILNNLGDVRNSIEDRNLFQTFILDQYFMPREESLVYNHLRPTGTRIIKAQEYLDIIITDFPDGVEFRFDSLEVVDFQMGSKFSEATVHVMFQVTPNKEEIAQPPLSFLLQVSGMSTSRISGRIKSIDRIPKPIEEPMVPILDLEDITIASQPTEPVQETATYSEATLDTSFNTIEVDKYLPKVIQDLERSMVFVEGGRFQMGCTEEQGKECKYIEKPAHWVELNSFYIGKFEVTQAQWEAITSSNPSRNRECEYCPVENVNWNEVNAFIKDLNKLTDKKYRLPTEAEWEYAARGGKKSQGYKYSGGDDPKKVAWYYKNSGRKTSPAGLQLPNELGLYDMSGNVSEWCMDWFEKYNPASNFPRSGSSSRKIVRGGYWYSQSDELRCSNRDSDRPKNNSSRTGFRLCLSLDEE